jgi:hypothetical protein
MLSSCKADEADSNSNSNGTGDPSPCRNYAALLAAFHFKTMYFLSRQVFYQSVFSSDINVIAGIVRHCLMPTGVVAAVRDQAPNALLAHVREVHW